MKIVIPSDGRANIITTHNLIEPCYVCIPESQKSQYLNRKGITEDMLLLHPNSVNTIPKKRNYILDNYMDDEAVVMLDDDIIAVKYLPTYRKIKDKKEVYDIVYKTYLSAVEMGAYLFGWAKHHNIVWFNEFAPIFIVTGYICGKSIGFRRGIDLRFDERFLLKEDYDITLQNLEKHRLCFVDNKYAFAEAKTMAQVGGLSKVRTVAKEKEMTELLKRKYGSIIKDKPIKSKGGVRERLERIGVEIALPF